MKSFTILVAALTVVIHALGQTTPQNPTQPATTDRHGNLMCRMRLFALPTAEANELLASPNLKSEPSAIIDSIRKLIANNKARVVGNPTIVTKSGNRAKSEGYVSMEIEPTLGADGQTVSFMTFLQVQGGGNLRYDSKLAIGRTEFAGTIDLPSASASTELCLVFFTIQ